MVLFNKQITDCVNADNKPVTNKRMIKNQSMSFKQKLTVHDVFTYRFIPSKELLAKSMTPEVGLVTTPTSPLPTPEIQKL